MTFWNGKPRVIKLLSNVAHDDFHRPSYGKKWLILSGEIKHVTGTDTLISVSDGRVASRNIIYSAQASGYYPYHTTRATIEQIAWTPVILDYDIFIHIATGDVTAECNLLVWEWE